MKTEHLNKLAQEIKTEQAGLLEEVRHTLRHAQRIGQLLLEVKKVKPTGGIDKWMQANCSFSVRSGYYYISIHQKWSVIEARLEDVADLTLAGAIQFIKKPKKNAADWKTTGEVTLPSVSAPISTRSEEPQAAVPTAQLQEPTIISVPTSESAPATLPMNLVARTSFEGYLAARMVAHGIQGTATALMALLGELGVDLGKLKAA